MDTIKGLVILFLFFTGMAKATVTDTIVEIPVYDILEELNRPHDNGGNVSIQSDVAIDSLVRLHILLNQKHKTFPGYRIQIFSGSSYDYPVDRLQEMKEGFEKDYPDIPAYLNYFDPDFKIRVGNFRNRLECIPALKKIRRRYPSSYPVKTEIPLSDLLKSSQPPVQETEEEKSTF